ncbi:MAG: hypothetical protein MZV64_34665 [Ignavibacteriales bacterium]|nr:hypothetical protein [Ignavibacteriales bacterium]
MVITGATLTSLMVMVSVPVPKRTGLPLSVERTTTLRLPGPTASPWAGTVTTPAAMLRPVQVEEASMVRVRVLAGTSTSALVTVQVVPVSSPTLAGQLRETVGATLTSLMVMVSVPVPKRTGLPLSVERTTTVQLPSPTASPWAGTVTTPAAMLRPVQVEEASMVRVRVLAGTSTSALVTVQVVPVSSPTLAGQLRETVGATLTSLMVMVSVPVPKRTGLPLSVERTTTVQLPATTASPWAGTVTTPAAMLRPCAGRGGVDGEGQGVGRDIDVSAGHGAGGAGVFAHAGRAVEGDGRGHVDLVDGDGVGAGAEEDRAAVVGRTHDHGAAAGSLHRFALGGNGDDAGGDAEAGAGRGGVDGEGQGVGRDIDVSAGHGAGGAGVFAHAGRAVEGDGRGHVDLVDGDGVGAGAEEDRAAVVGRTHDHGAAAGAPPLRPGRER